MTINELLKAFGDNVALQKAAVLAGQQDGGNEYADNYTSAFKELCARFGDEGRRALQSLFLDERPVVRVTAATCLLRFDTEGATAVLEGVANGKGYDAFAAAQSLKRWEEGAWSIDPLAPK